MLTGNDVPQLAANSHLGGLLGGKGVISHRHRAFSMCSYGNAAPHSKSIVNGGSLGRFRCFTVLYLVRSNLASGSPADAEVAMADRIAEPEDRSADLPGFGVPAARAGISSCQWPTSRTYWILLILFVELQIADILTTNKALTIPGVWELNPLMAMSQAKFGAAWWVPKLTVAAYLCLAATLMRRRWPIIFAVWVSSLAVLGNISHF